LTSSSAKADDPVWRAVYINLNRPGILDAPLPRGMTTTPGLDAQ
jgi:hypothetical protein